MKLHTYKELQQYVQAAANGKIGLLIVHGRGGVGKSHTIKAALKGREHLLLSSHLTPASCYEQLYNHRDAPVFLNDIDKIFLNPVLLSLLKQATETEEEKKLQYNSKTPLMADLPREFTTTSTLIVDANELPKKSKNLKALFTRGVVVDFEPSNEEVLKVLKTFAKDEEIYTAIAEAGRLRAEIHFRAYVVAKQLKTAGLDWRNYLEQELTLPQNLLLLKDILEHNKTYKERVRVWKEKTGKSERTFDRLKKKLEVKG